MFRINQGDLITLLAAAGTAFALEKGGMAAKIPAIGGVSPVYIMLIGGAILAAGVRAEGTSGDIIRGVGFGAAVVAAAAL